MSKTIELTQGKFAIVDDEDFEWLNQWKWCAHFEKTHWYAIRSIRPKNSKPEQVRMHRIIINTPKDLLVDHINHNSLDNRKENLRVCTIAQNQYNQTARLASSKYKGVSWQKVARKWKVEIIKNRKCFHVGLFENEIDAAKAYNVKAKELFGEFAGLNQTPESTTTCASL
jgi:hypothetical protein